MNKTLASLTYVSVILMIKKKTKQKNKARVPRLIANARVSHSAPTGTRLGFPTEKTVTLPYSDHLLTVAASGVMTNYQFRLNSAFDVDFTSTGHQPLGFDQWSLFYNHYVVKEVRWSMVTAPNNGNYMAAFYVSDDATVPTTSVTELIELGAQGGLGTIHNPMTFDGKLDVAQFFNRPRKSLNLDDSLRSLVGTSPSDIVFGNLLVQRVSGTALLQVDVVFTLEFDITFSEPKDLAAS